MTGDQPMTDVTANDIHSPRVIGADPEDWAAAFMAGPEPIPVAVQMKIATEWLGQTNPDLAQRFAAAWEASLLEAGWDLVE